MSAAEGDLDAYLVLAEEMEEKDPHYASVLGVRKRAVSGVTPIVEPASEDAKDTKIADAVRDNIAEHDGFPDLVEDMLDALGKGFSVVEIDWKKTARVWTPQEFIFRDPRFFKFDRDTGREIRLIDERDIVDGIALEPFKFIRHKAKIKSGIAARGGLARLVAFSWICKAYDTKDWMSFVETYGLPLRLGRYGPEATKSDVEKLFMAVANIGTDAAAVLPRSMSIDFEEISSGTGNEVFENLARWVDEQVSKAVLGQTMTSDSGSASAQVKDVDAYSTNPGDTIVTILTHDNTGLADQTLLDDITGVFEGVRPLCAKRLRCGHSCGADGGHVLGSGSYLGRSAIL